MTREQAIAELQHRATQKYLIYLALQEIMLDNYEDCTLLKDFDNDLRLKHKNLINALKRNATKAYRFLENYEDGEATIRQFHDFTRLFEGLHLAIDAGGSVFHDCLNEVEKILIENGLKESTNLPEQTQ